VRVLIVDDIAETRENLRKLLSFEPDIDVVGVAGSGSEGIHLAKDIQPDVVLMDINMPGMDGITATERLLQQVPATQVVVLSVQGETDYLRRAMLAGAREYLTKPASADELVNTIHRVFEMGRIQTGARRAIESDVRVASPGEERRPRSKGDIVAVFAPKGGTGCTTVAVNTAVALHQIAGDERKVALVDSNLQFGDVGVMLNLRPNRSIADLAQRIGELDSDLLSSVMMAHGSGVKVLLAPPRPEAAESLLNSHDVEEEEGRSPIEAILDTMRDDFDIVVADMWSWIDDLSLSLFDTASLIVLVVMPDIPSVKSARLFLELASKLDYSGGKLVLVVNGADRRGSLQVNQIEKAIMPVTAEIPFDERAALAAANHGVPLVVRDRSRPISKGILALAEIIHDRLSGVHEHEEETEEEAQALGVGGTNILRLKRAFDRS
jgi:pilus assembly protein CpaE